MQVNNIQVIKGNFHNPCAKYNLRVSACSREFQAQQLFWQHLTPPSPWTLNTTQPGSTATWKAAQHQENHQDHVPWARNPARGHHTCKNPGNDQQLKQSNKPGHEGLWRCWWDSMTLEVSPNSSDPVKLRSKLLKMVKIKLPQHPSWEFKI